MKRPGGLACVLGDLNLIRPLGLAGIRSAVVAEPGKFSRYSRFAAAVIDATALSGAEELLDRLMRFAASQREPPVLYYQEDYHLLFVSRFRSALQAGFRFVVPPPDLVEVLVDKVRFYRFAEKVGWRVPRTAVLSSPDGAPGDLAFPLVVKPATRTAAWQAVGGSAKALRLDRAADLVALTPHLVGDGGAIIAQELIPGPETRIESYHAYVGDAGEVVAEFTGRKIRTRPTDYGYSSALEITDVPEVAAAGRAVLRAIDFRGVAKVDFKRAEDGELWLLEINPRFNLWHHPGALAGVNIPALVWSRLVGRETATAPKARPGVRWMKAADVKAAADHGVPLWRWVPWAVTAEAKSHIAWDDPLPLLHWVADGLRAKLRTAPSDDHPDGALERLVTAMPGVAG